MRIKGLLLMLSCAAVLAVPAGAQTDSTAEPGRKGHQFSPALQKKVAERTAALRANDAAPVGPLLDHSSKNWTIETAACPLVKSQLKGTGFKGHTVWVTMNDDGSFHVQLRTEAAARRWTPAATSTFGSTPSWRNSTRRIPTPTNRLLPATVPVRFN
jgi:hypothetical protein